LPHCSLTEPRPHHQAGVRRANPFGIPPCNEERINIVADSLTMAFAIRHGPAT